jgi:hypothetical protein
LVQCLFLLLPPFLRVAYSCAVVDKKDHTIGAIQPFAALTERKNNFPLKLIFFVEKPWKTT